MHTIQQHYINGSFVPSQGRDTLTLHSPVTGEALTEVTLGDARDVGDAIAAAKAAFRTFSRSSREQRLELLERLHAVLRAHRGELIDVMVAEYGSPVGFTEMIIDASINDFVEMAKVLRGFDFSPRAGNAQVRLQGVGVVGVIIPWNSSNGFICTKLASAIAAGCSVVIKPSELSARQTEVMARLLHKAELPKGLVNIVNGSGAVAGAELTRHPDIAKITFTGSTEVGKTIARGAADTMKRLTLELGGKSPNILLDDADFATAVPQAVFAAYLNSGQACVAATRLLVPAARREEAEALIRATVDGIQVGDPADAGTHIGPMVNATQWQRVQDYIALGIEEGARLLAGGPGKPEGLEAGHFVKPTVFTDVDNRMRIAQEEIFGPVLCVIPYADEAEAIAIANDTRYGLAAYVSSADAQRAAALGEWIDAGRICINGAWHDPQAPFGGFKQSGIGREFGVFGLGAYLEPKALIGV